jgi:hypothetical protein
MRNVQLSEAEHHLSVAIILLKIAFLKGTDRCFWLTDFRNICEPLWLLECGAVKQWEMSSLLCAHCLPANRTFQNRKSGWITRSFIFDLANEARLMGWRNSHGARFAKTTANCSNSFCHFHLTLSQPRTQALIYPWVGLGRRPLISRHYGKLSDSANVAKGLKDLALTIWQCCIEKAFHITIGVVVRKSISLTLG